MEDKKENSKAEVKGQGHPKRLKYERKVRRYRQFRRYNMYLIRFSERVKEQQQNKIRGKGIEKNIKIIFQTFKS